MHVTLLAAGFLIGPSGVSIRSVAQKTAAEIRSWSETLAVRGRNRRIRTIVVEVSCHHSCLLFLSALLSIHPKSPRSTHYWLTDSLPTFAIPCSSFQGNRRSVVLAVAVLTDAIDLYKELCEGKYCGKVVDRVQIIRGVEFFYSPPPRSAVPFAAALRPEGGGATSPSAAGIKALAKETSAGHARPQKENNGAPQRIQWNIGGATYINAWPGLGSATATQGTGAGGAPVPELPSHKEAHVQTLKSEMPQLPGPEFDLGHDSYALAVENALQAAGHSRPPAHNEDAQIPCLTDPVVPRPYFSGSQHRPFLHAALNEGQLPATSNRSAIFAAAAKVNAVAAEWQRAPGPPQMRQTAPTSAWNQYGDSEQVHRPQQEYAMFPNRFQGASNDDGPCLFHQLLPVAVLPTSRVAQEFISFISTMSAPAKLRPTPFRVFAGWPFGMTPRTAADGPQGEAPMGLTHGVMHPSSAMPQGWLGSPMVPITDDQLRWFGLPTFGDFAEKVSLNVRDVQAILDWSKTSLASFS